MNEKFINEVSQVLAEQILKLEGLDINKINILLLVSICNRAAKDLETICMKNYNERIDKFTAEQLKANIRHSGKLQIIFEEYLGTIINITRYSDDSLDDIEIQLINKDNNYYDVISVIERNHNTQISISDRDNRKNLKKDDNGIRYYKDSEEYKFLDLKELSLDQMIELFRSGELDKLIDPSSNKKSLKNT